MAFEMTIDLQDRNSGTGWVQWMERSRETIDARRENGKWILDGAYAVELRGEGRTLKDAAKQLMRETGCTEGTLRVGKEFGDWAEQTYTL